MTENSTEGGAPNGAPNGVGIPKEYVPCAQSAHRIYQIEAGSFSGPLDLLLFLIRRHQIDVFDIPISFICTRYLDCLQQMEDVNVDVAAEFLWMASELLHIKSVMLLPQPPDMPPDMDMLEEPDPRAQLVARLLEYQKYRLAAAYFNTLPRLDRDLFAHPGETLPDSLGDPPWQGVALFALARAFYDLLKRQTPQMQHQVEVEQISVRHRILLLTQDLLHESSVVLEGLLTAAPDRLHQVVTFLAVLEMVRLKLFQLYESQEGRFYLQPCFTKLHEALASLAEVHDHDYTG